VGPQFTVMPPIAKLLLFNWPAFPGLLWVRPGPQERSSCHGTNSIRALKKYCKTLERSPLPLSVQIALTPGLYVGHHGL